MKISIDYIGTYTEHKDYFDAMAAAMQAHGHQVGIITGEREKVEVAGGQFVDKKEELLKNLGFKPDFVYMWGQFETIANGSIWKAQKMVIEGVLVHFDDDATEMKRYTDRWVIKTMNSGDMRKF